MFILSKTEGNNRMQVRRVVIDLRLVWLASLDTPYGLDTPYRRT
jgi:hypothetical protein